MLLVGLENCPGCKILHSKYPEIPYVELPKMAANSDKDTFEVKKAIGLLGITDFPVLVNDAITKTLPLTLIDPNIKVG